MTNDVRSPQWLKMIRLLGALISAAVGQDSLAWGQAYVANSGSGTVSVIDTSSNTVSGDPITVGGQPFRVAVTPNGRFVYVTDSAANSVSVIDAQAAPPAVLKMIPLAGSGRGVAIRADGHFAYVVGGQSLHKIDVVNNHTIVGSPLLIQGSASNGPEGVAVTPDGNFAYVADKNSNIKSLFVIDAVNMSMIFPFYDGAVQPAAIGGSSPRDVVVRPDGLFVYNTSFTDGAVQVLRVSDNSHPGGGCIRSGGGCLASGPIGIATSGVGGIGNGQFIFTVNSNVNSVSIYQVNDGSGLPIADPTNVTVGDGPTNTNSPQYLAVTPNGQVLYVTNKLKNSVEVINLASSPPAKVETIPVGIAPLGIAVSPLSSGPPAPALIASLAASPGTVTVGQTIAVAMTVSNTGGSPASSISPQSSLSKSGTGDATETSGPSPGPTTIGPGNSQAFTYAYSASAAGTVSFSGSASGGGVSSNTATSNAVTIQAPQLPPTLSVAPPSLGFTGEQGLADPVPQAIQVANAGGGTLTWSSTSSTTSGGNWLTVNPATGSAPPAVPISVAAGICGLPAGSYSGSAVVAASGANGSPQAIPVTLTVTQPVTPLPSPGARVCTDRPAYRTGDILRLSVSLRQGSASNTGDAYFFALVPGTTTFVSLVLSAGVIVPQFGPAPVPLGTNFQVQNFAGEVFARSFDGSESAGTYGVKAILARPGTDPTVPANQLASGMGSFTFAP